MLREWLQYLRMDLKFQKKTFKKQLRTLDNYGYLLEQALNTVY